MGSALSVGSAQAWYDHRAVMDHVLLRLEREIPSPQNDHWKKPLVPPATIQNQRYSELASLLLLNSRGELPSLSATTPHDLLRLGADDPDFGMDKELPDSADPSDDRDFMGGSQGTSSMGFRHMYWAGWDWRKPITTFQVPPRVLGQSPDRIDLLAHEARDKIRKGDLAWGLRILGWTIHYLQDLTQPFHAAQIPSLRMVPWHALFVWPPTDGPANLVRETTRTITNYHWAYEGYTRETLLLAEHSPLRECFEKSDGTLLVSSPRELALEIAQRSVARTPEMAKGLLDLVGTDLMKKEVSLIIDPKKLDVADLLKNPTRQKAREALNRPTCESLRLATDATIWIVKWAFTAKGP